jgi:tripartite-type tricarboxylate transporter receptor subunit TctC
VPYPPGGPTDTLARIIADRINAPIGQPLVIENISGAGGSTVIGRVAHSTSDGYTLSAPRSFCLLTAAKTAQGVNAGISLATLLH